LPVTDPSAGDGQGLAKWRATFEEQGFVVVPGALDDRQLDWYLRLHERMYRQERSAGRLAGARTGTNRPGAMHAFAFVLRDPSYLDLLDLATTFPLVRDILGWNIFMYHCHIDQHPPVDRPVDPVWGWHQDGGRQNLELDGRGTRPRLSVKVAYFLSDVSQPGRGNLLVIPGSHRWNHLPRPERAGDGVPVPEGVTPVCVQPGDAVVFDRRLWHSRSDNHSAITRKALFLAYTYRWIRPRDEYPIDWGAHPFRNLSPLRKQLLGWGRDALSFWGLGEDEVPLRRLAGLGVGPAVVEPVLHHQR
jgi:ectoine hydroxylase